MESQRQIQDWPIRGIQPHLQNRPVRKNAKFQELLESIKSIGIQQPLIVRAIAGRQDRVELLSGHRRLAAALDAELKSVPVDHRGEISDAEAFDVMAISNLHEELSPLEEGQRAALWLDHYDQDAQAVASKLGKTPRWVVEHAQIHRNLVADWHQAAESGKTKYGSSLAEQLERWTASHWAVIARLPQRIQLAQLKKFQSGSYCSFDRWTVKELEERIGLEMLSLAKAPFDTGTCKDCLNRTGAQPAFLWADDVEGAVGDKEKCLDAKCYQRKCEKAQKAEFVARRSSLNYPDAVPLSTLVEPKDYWKGGEAYRKQLSALKKVHGKDLVTSETVEVVKKGKDWDVHPEKRPKDVRPAIVVAGKGKGSVVFVKPNPVAKAMVVPGGRSRSRESIMAAQAESNRQQERWRKIEEALQAAIKKLPVPSLSVVAMFDSCLAPDYGNYGKQIAAAVKKLDQPGFEDWVRKSVWDYVARQLGYSWIFEQDENQAVADLLGIPINVQEMYERLAAEETPPPAGAKKGKPKKAKGVTAGTVPDVGTPGVCRVCGCTDGDCSECVEETGEPCTWVEPDLCSRCAAKLPGKPPKAVSNKPKRKGKKK